MLASHPIRPGYRRGPQAIECLCACENPVCPEDHVAHAQAEAGATDVSLLRQLPGAVARLRSRQRSPEARLRPS
jgi:hypothetical protein